MARTKIRARVKLSVGQADDSSGSLPTPGTDTFDEVGQIRDITLPEASKDESEVTDLQQDFREYLSTLPDPGEIAFEGFRDLATPDVGQATLRADAAAAVYRNYQIEVEDPVAKTTLETIDVVGECMEFQVGITQGDVVPFSGRIRARALATVT